MNKCVILVTTFCSAWCCFPSIVSAGNVFQDTWGVITDPFKLSASSRELSDSLNRTMIQLSALEGQTNFDMKARLEQVRSIINDAIGGSEQVIENATAAMRGLEVQTYIDADNLIYRAKCAVDVTLLDTAQKAFAGLLNTIGKSDPSFRIFGLRIIDLSTNNVQIENPDIAYRSAKFQSVALLEQKVSDNSPAYDIISLYQNLEKAAQYNRCYYINQVGAEVWAEEIADWERKSTPWVYVVHPDIDAK